MLFITGPGKTSIENHFDLNGELIQMLRETGKEDLLAELEFERRRLQYFYTRQRQTLGLGHAVLCARSFVGHEPFVVALGDSIIGLHAQSDVVRRMTACFDERQAAAVIAFEEVPREEVHHYGIAKPADAGEIFEIEDLIEKPSVDEAPSTLAIAARYVLSPDDLRRARDDTARQGRRDPADRRASARSSGRAAGSTASGWTPASAATTSATSTPTSARSSSSRWPIPGTARRSATTWRTCSMLSHS